jgi:kynurenine--oxoglutarate transaminase/cysteine-S-conjugate beta-lyase/glutamine--phenylpyruvate transaminase
VWQLDLAQLEAAFSPRTKLFLLNTPHNPTGRVFSRAELLQMADILTRYPHVTVICDEVYENLVFSPEGHTRLGSLPGLWERVITVSSAGKTFSVTGWKVGWAIGPAGLVQNLALVNQWVQYSVSTPAQRAVADMLETASLPYMGSESYYAHLRHVYQVKMDALVESVRASGLIPLRTQVVHHSLVLNTWHV